MTEKLRDIAMKLKILKSIKDIGRKNINKNKKEKKFDKNNLKINKMETKNGRRRQNEDKVWNPNWRREALSLLG